MIRPQGKFLVPAGPNLKNSAWPSIISLLRRESSLLAEEFQHGSVLLPFEKGEDECNSRGHTDQYAERKAEGVHGKGRAGDLLNLAHGWASSINGAASYSLFRFCPWDNTGMVGVGIMQLESISKACAENWEDCNNLGEKKKKSSHCALLVKINSHAALLHILPKLRRRQNTNNAGISIYSFMILCMFSELRMWPLSRNQVMSNLWDYGVVEYQQCKNW